jgi:hypothetical protein
LEKYRKELAVMEEKLRAIKKDLHLKEEPLRTEIEMHIKKMYGMVDSLRSNIDKLEAQKAKAPSIFLKMAELGIIAGLKTLDTTIGFCIKLAK